MLQKSIVYPMIQGETTVGDGTDQEESDGDKDREVCHAVTSVTSL